MTSNLKYNRIGFFFVFFLLWFGLTAHLLKREKLFLIDQKGGALFRELLLQSDHIHIIFYSESVKRETNVTHTHTHTHTNL